MLTEDSPRPGVGAPFWARHLPGDEAEYNCSIKMLLVSKAFRTDNYSWQVGFQGPRPSRLREDAILDACTRILVSKGLRPMTMDDVANEVGISKPSLYKHFQVERRPGVRGHGAPARWRPGVPASARQPRWPPGVTTCWSGRAGVRLGGGLPFLPSTSPQGEGDATRHLGYVARAMKLHSRLLASTREAGAKPACCAKTCTRT